MAAGTNFVLPAALFMALRGRVMEMLSEHTVEGWLAGYLLSGRHGFINSYEPFIHVIDSMFNTKGAGILDWASNDQGVEPDVMIASCGGVPTMESLAATALLCENLPDIKVRFVNVVDLFKLVPHTKHSHGMTDREFEAIFTSSKPMVFNFHSYPWLIHRLTYRRPGQHNIHVRGYKEKGSINTPLELAIHSQPDRFSLGIDAIDRIPRFCETGSGVRETLLNEQVACLNHAYKFGVDRQDIAEWKWPFYREARRSGNG